MKSSCACQQQWESDGFLIGVLNQEGIALCNSYPATTAMTFFSHCFLQITRASFQFVCAIFWIYFTELSPTFGSGVLGHSASTLLNLAASPNMLTLLSFARFSYNLVLYKNSQDVRCLSCHILLIPI